MFISPQGTQIYNTMFISLRIILKDNSMFKVKMRTMCYGGVYNIWWNKIYDNDHKEWKGKWKYTFQRFLIFKEH